MLDDFKYREPDPNRRPVAQVWDERYAAPSYLFGKEPTPFLKHYVGYLKKGKAIDIAMGEGRNAAFLASQGFQVEGVDCSAKAIEKAKNLATEKGVAFDAKVQNLDFFLMPLMRFDTILMTYFRPLPRFFSEIRRGLVPGGTFLLEAYTVDQLKGAQAPNPLIEGEDCYRPNEVLSHLKDFHLLFYREMPEGNLHLVQAIAQKLKA
jgi:tellurite methyltransferase